MSDYIIPIILVISGTLMLAIFYSLGNHKDQEPQFPEGNTSVPVVKIIQKHSAFNEIREKYEWDEVKGKFPEKLSSGEPNPLFGVTGFFHNT